jgi:hypothetical protein
VLVELEWVPSARRSERLIEELALVKQELLPLDWRAERLIEVLALVKQCEVSM